MSYALGNITYADTPGDWGLEHFSTAHDDAYILPVLRRAKALVRPPLAAFELKTTRSQLPQHGVVLELSRSWQLPPPRAVH